jgi:predicted alpha/beta-hydrolase family hydrolase
MLLFLFLMPLRVLLLVAEGAGESVSEQANQDACNDLTAGGVVVVRCKDLSGVRGSRSENNKA